MSFTLDDPDLRRIVRDTLAGSAAQGAVVCLCAAWCGTCREFEPVFRKTAHAHPELAFRWLDIEDEADALGDLDIETFPTVVISGPGGALQFAGPVLPHAKQLGRLLRSLHAQG